MQTLSSHPRTSAAHYPADFAFDTWINDQDDCLFDDDLSSFDTNWIVSATDLFGTLELPIADEQQNQYDEAA